MTELYEILPLGEDVGVAAVDTLKYQQPTQTSRDDASSNELMTAKLRGALPAS